MELENYWNIDGNYYSKDKFAYETAEALAKTLKNCKYCVDCEWCRDCKGSHMRGETSD